MKYIFLIYGIVFLFPPTFVGAEGFTPDITQAKILQKILELDSRPPSKQVKTQRKALFTEVVKDLRVLRSTWSLIPTYDATRRYTPYLQKYPLSCEIAALVMVIASLGGSDTEDELIEQLPVFPAPYTGGIWGDPDREFVGSIRGSQRKMTGFGVYPLPLSKLIEGRYFSEIYTLTGSDISRDVTAKNMMSYYLSQIENGSHVILWGDWCTRPEYEDGILSEGKSRVMQYFPIAGRNECERLERDRTMKWKTPEGKSIEGLSGEHAFVLLGYIGPREDPKYIIVWDTDTGRHIYPTVEWMRKWKALEYRALLVGESL